MEKLLAFLDKLAEVILVDEQALREEGIGEAPCSFRNEAAMARDGLQVRLDLGPEDPRLFAELEVVVKDLLLLSKR